MTFRYSTGLRNAMAGTVGFAGALSTGVIDIYTGPQPLSADSPMTGTLLGTYTKDAGAFVAGVATNGLVLSATAGVCSKTSDNWKCVGIAAGTAGCFRFRGNATDANGTSTTLCRFDGSVGTSGADMNIANIVFEVGTPESIDTFTYTQPAA